MWLKKKSNILFIIILLTIGVVSHLEWFNPKSLLTYSDWYYWPDVAIKELGQTWGPWVRGYWGLGRPNAQIYFNIFMQTWSWLSNFGFSYDQAVKLTLLIPISLMGFVTPFLLAYKLSRNSIVSFLSAMFYGSNTYFLSVQTSHIPIAFVNSLAPVIVLLFIEAIKKNTYKSWILFTAVFSVVINFEIRIGIVLALILFVYFTIFGMSIIRKYIIRLFVSGMLLILLNSYWIFPTVFSGIGNQIGSVANRGLFGNNLYSLTNSLTLSIWSWTGNYPDQQFNRQNIFWWFWLLPLIIIFPIEVTNEVDRKRLWFFTTISILGLFLTKQSGPPLEYAYLWLYKHIPVFNIFREASKLYLLVAVGYLGIVAIKLKSIFELLKLNKIVIYSISVILFILFGSNLIPAFNQNMDTMFKNRIIPNDYKILNSFLSTQSGFFRTLSVPRYSKWGYFSDNNPRLFLIETLENDWNQISEYNKPSSGISIPNKINYFMNLSFFHELINMSSIRYLIVPNRDKVNNDDFFVYYGDSQKYYLDLLNNLKWANKIDLGTSELVLYENPEYKPFIYSTLKDDSVYSSDEKSSEVKYFKVGSGEYKLEFVPQVTTFLNFAEAYDSGWKIRSGEFNWIKSIASTCYHLDDKLHYKNSSGTNTFVISPENISENTSITIYYEPQGIYKFGILLSGVSYLLAIITVILLTWRK